MSLLFTYIKQNQWILYKNYIRIILVDFYVSLSRFFLLLGSGSTFPDVDPVRPNDTDPTGSETLQVGFVFGYFQLHFKSITMNLVNIWEKITECLYKTWIKMEKGYIHTFSHFSLPCEFFFPFHFLPLIFFFYVIFFLLFKNY